MANALNKDLELGSVVVFKKANLRPQYAEQDRRLVVRVGMFGAYAGTTGNKLGVTWMSDKAEEVISGYDLDRNESEKAEAEIESDPQYGWLFKIIHALHRQLAEARDALHKAHSLVAKIREENAPKNLRIVSVVGTQDTLDGQPSEDGDDWLIYVTRSNGLTRSYRLTEKTLTRLSDVCLRNMQTPYSQFDRFMFYRWDNDLVE